jgi:hypothetical protein
VNNQAVMEGDVIWMTSNQGQALFTNLQIFQSYSNAIFVEYSTIALKDSTLDGWILIKN